MKNIIIKIDKEEVLKQVSLNSSYTGAKIEGDIAIFDRVAALESDSVILHRFWLDLCGKITEKLKTMLTQYTISDSSLTMTLELSNAYDDALTESVHEDIFSSISAGVLARWYALCLPEKSREWEIKSGDILDRAFSKLCHRLRPIRR